MIKSLCLWSFFQEYDFYDRFKKAKEVGFTHVEFSDWDGKDLDKIKSLLEKYDLTLTGFSGDMDLSIIDIDHTKRYIDYVKKSIDAAKFLECENLIIHSNGLGEGGVILNDYAEKSFAEKMAVMAGTLVRLAPIAEDAGVTLNLEALNIEEDHKGCFLAHTRDSVAAVIPAMSPNIKINYDVYHMQLSEGKLVNTLKECIDYIGYIHIADAPGRAEPGTGEINFNIIWKTLKELKYIGPVGFELIPSGSNEVEIASSLLTLF